MKTHSDKTQTELQPPLIINPKSVDTYNDAITIGIESLSQADNIMFDNGMIEKVPGISARMSAAVISANGGVYGLHRTYSPAGTKTCLRLHNGTLRSGHPNFATTVLSNLAANKRTPWVDVRGKAYGINETDGIMRYDPEIGIGVKVGIVGPHLRKKIAFFEVDEVWSTTNGGSQSTAVYRPDEWSGDIRRSLRLYCTSASVNASASSPIQVCLSAFDNGRASTDKDYISFHTFHTTRANISGCYIDFSHGDVAFTNYYRAYIDQEKFNGNDQSWTDWNLKRGAFSAVGSPGWNAISAVRLVALSNTGGGVSIYFDKLHMKIAPPLPAEMRRRLFACENGNEVWTFKNGTYAYQRQHEGARSIKLGPSTPSAYCALSTPVDLAKWQNGVSTSDSDELVFFVRATDDSKLNSGNPLTVKVGSGISAYYKKTFSGYTDLGINGKSNQWVEVRIPKARISATTAGISAPDWTAINTLKFLPGSITGTHYLYIDDCYFEQKKTSILIADFETDETWAITGKGVNNHEDPHGKGWVTEGECALKLWGRKNNDTTATINLASTADLTKWADGLNSSTEDEISFSLYHQYISKIDRVELWFGCADSSFTDGFKYIITKDMFAGGGSKNFMGKEIRIRKVDFDTIGTSALWSNIHCVKWVVAGKGDRNTGAVYIDNLQLRRKSGFTGRYYYKYLFKVDDICSACSEISEPVDSGGAKIALSDISVSQDSRVTSREVYRMGGSYPDAWGLVKELDDNTTTEVIDDVDDDQIIYFLGDDVPQGWINEVLCNNMIHDAASDRMLYWGDPSYKNRVWFSHPGYYHVVDEWGYRDFPDDVMSVMPWFGQTIIFYRNYIQKIVNGDITEGSLIDVPVEVGACSYWAVAPPWNGLIPFVSDDNAYLFDGIKVQPFGDKIKNHFLGREEYLSTIVTAIHKNVFYVACKGASGTPTYNNTVLRCYLPNKGWSIIPDWNVNVWSNWDKQDDNNDLFFGDSNTNAIYSLNESSYQFGSDDIDVDFDTGWLSYPDGDISINRIEFKAKGTAASTITFNGYINNGSSPTTTGVVTLTAEWQVFRLGPVGIMDLLRGNNVKVEFTQGSQDSWFKMKDIIVYAEKLPERISITTANEIACAAP